LMVSGLEKFAGLNGITIVAAMPGDEKTRFCDKCDEHVYDLSARTEWAWRLEEQLAERTLHVQVQTDRIAEYEAHVAALSETLRKLGEERRMIAESRWIRLGRKLGVGTVLAATGEE